MSWLAIIGFICLGGFLAFFLNGLKNAKGNLLQQEFVKLGDLRNKSLDEIVGKVGVQTSFQPCTITDRDNEQGFFYTWTANNYSITLLFDSNKKCIGVNSETKI